MNINYQTIYHIVKTMSINGHLSVPRCIKIIYLIDWYSSFVLRHNSGLKWFHGLCGPTEKKLEEMLSMSSDYVEVRTVDNHMGGEKMVLSCKEGCDVADLSKGDKEIISTISSKVRGMTWNDFILLVSSTYPMLNTFPGQCIDMKTLAMQYSKMLS